MRNRINNIKTNKPQLNEAQSLFSLFKDAPLRDKSSLKRVDMLATNHNQCKVLYDGQHVYSAAKFHSGDIIEICPTRSVTKQALYSREVRDMVFEVIPDEQFVIPLGYCQHYDIISKRHPVPNCTWEWNPITETIVIRANCTIPKETLLVLDIEK